MLGCIINSTSGLGRLNSKRLEKYNCKDFKAIIIDEAHHATSTTYQRILEHFNVYDKDSTIYVWGCSATLRRHDGLALSPTFEMIAYDRPVLEMINENWLCPVKLLRIKTKVDLSEIKITNHDFNIKELCLKIDTEERNELIVEKYLEQIGNRKSTLVFAANVEHIDNLVKSFNDKGVAAYGLDGTLDLPSRDKVLNDFKNHKFPVLVNCGILTEGTDIPHIDSIILARPTISKVLLQQMIGRGMRLHKDKKDCLVLDFVDSVQGQTLTTAPTLLGLDNNVIKEPFSGNSKSLTEFVEQNLSTDSSQMQLTSQLFPFTDPFSPKSIQQDYDYIKKFTKLPWTRVGQSKWILAISNSFTITLEQINGLYKAFSNKRFKNPSYHWRSQLIMQNDEFKPSMLALESYLKREIGFNTLEMMKSKSKWRDLKATPKQIETLKRFNIPNENITRGEAYDMITRSKCIEINSRC